MRYLPNGIWMQKADSYTIREIGVPSVVLMEHAAQKTIEVMERENIDFSDILIVCGSGNNGGDGFAIARLLQEKGVRVTVFFAGKERPENLQQLPCKSICQSDIAAGYVVFLF